MGKSTNSRQSKFNLKVVGLRTTAAGVLPFAVLSAYLVFSRWPSRWFTGLSDFAAGAVAVLLGSAFIATLPTSREVRVLLLLFYVPILCVLLFFYGLEFVGMVFGDWV